MSCRLQIESLSTAVEDPLTAWLVIEMCSPWTPGFTNPYVLDKPVSLSNETVRNANEHLPQDALSYVEWTHWTLNTRLADWHRTQFETAREIVRYVALTHDTIHISYS